MKPVNISAVIRIFSLKACLIFSMIFMFMAAHIYISSQPVSSVLMAEILEEHEEDAHDCNSGGESVFVLFPQSFLLTAASHRSDQAISSLIISIVKEVYSIDPPPPKA